MPVIIKRSRYKKWPSAYASGALVRCRKVGAKNWGNKSKKVKKSCDCISKGGDNFQKEKKVKDYTVGFQEEAERNQKAVKHKEDGLIVVHVVQKMDQNLVEEKMHLREQKEDVGQLVLLVRHISEGRVHLELECFEERPKERNR